MTATINTTDEFGLERLLNVNELTRLLGVERGYFSKRIVKETNFLEIAPAVRLYGNGSPKYQLKDVLKFIESRKAPTIHRAFVLTK